MARSFLAIDLDDDVLDWAKRRAKSHLVSVELFLSAILESHVNHRRATGHTGADLWADVAPGVSPDPEVETAEPMPDAGEFSQEAQSDASATAPEA